MIKLYYPSFWQKKTLLAYLLLPFGYLYLFLGYLRKLLISPVRLPAYVICIGNCTVGGTGKTQLIIKLAKELVKRNINFIILCKGYGGKCKVPTLVTASSHPDLVGDEALELCRYGNSFVVPKLKDAINIAKKYKPDVILLDDGMQNPWVEKDFVVMTVDGTRGFGNEFPLPAGPMRSSISSALNVADAIVILDKSFRINSKLPYFDARITSDKHFGDFLYYAFAGIGNPEKFFNHLRKNGAKVKRTMIFPDHYKYSKNDVISLLAEAKTHNLKLITTRKDYVKISRCFEDNHKAVFPAACLEFAGVVAPHNMKDVDIEIDYLEVGLEINHLDELMDLVLEEFEK